MGLCNRFEGGIYTKKRESASLVQRREEESKRVHSGVDEERIYKTIKITTDSISILCGKEEWKEENDVGLLVFE